MHSSKQINTTRGADNKATRTTLDSLKPRPITSAPAQAQTIKASPAVTNEPMAQMAEQVPSQAPIQAPTQVTPEPAATPESTETSFDFAAAMQSATVPSQDPAMVLPPQPEKRKKRGFSMPTLFKKSTKPPLTTATPALPDFSGMGTELPTVPAGSTNTATEFNFDPIDSTAVAAAQPNIMDEASEQLTANLIDQPDLNGGATESNAQTVEPTDPASVQPTDPFNPAEATTGQDQQPSTKSNQPKQLTVSILTIIFGLLFLISAGLATWFFLDKSKLANQLSDSNARLQSIKDRGEEAENTSNKSSTQFDALQKRIKELTKTGEDQKKVIDEQKSNIDNVKKQLDEANNKLTEAQKKIASDEKVSNEMKSLVTTLCTKEDFRSAAPCVENNHSE